MRVAKGNPPPEPPGHIATLIHTLEKSGFRTIYRDEVAQGFGDFMQVLERPPVRIRVVRDRGQWSAQLTARAAGVGSALTSVLGFFHGPEAYEILGVPDEGWVMACCVSFGYPLGRWGVAPRRPVHEVSSRNRWGTPIGFELPEPLWSPENP